MAFFFIQLDNILEVIWNSFSFIIQKFNNNNTIEFNNNLMIVHN
jgi:hypothetical protein